MEKHRRYAVIGGAGFLGQHLVHLLLNDDRTHNASLVIIDKAPSLEHIKLMHPEDFSDPRVTLALNVDISDRDILTLMLDQVDCVFHLAAAIAYGRKNKSLLHKVNILGVKNVIESSQKAGVKKLIYVSSCAVLKCLDDQDKTRLTSEFNSERNWNKERFCHYGLSKYQGEQLALNATNLNSVAVIPGILLGPGPGHHASTLPFQIAREKNWTLIPKGGSNYIDVRDVARGLVEVSQHERAKGRYLFVSQNLEHRELLQEIVRCYNRTMRFIEMPKFVSPLLGHLLSLLEWLLPKHSPYSKEGVLQSFRFRYFSYKTAHEEFNWKPIHSIQQTLEDTIHWLNHEQS